MPFFFFFSTYTYIERENLPAYAHLLTFPLLAPVLPQKKSAIALSNFIL